MRIGHWQLECIPGDVQANTNEVVEHLELAAKAGIEVLSFPESMLTGYYRTEELARANSIETDGAEIAELLARTASRDLTFMVGYNERRGEELRNTVLVARAGKILGTYSKAFPCFGYFTPGRDFPVFQHDDLIFGVVICADGGYIEPTRILALKGARVVFAPHYNYIAAQGLLDHFVRVRSDHTARARENEIWFLRGNNVCSGRDAGLDTDGVGYGDSYLVDPTGEIIVRGQRHVENLLSFDLPTPLGSATRRSLVSAQALGEHLLEVVRDLPEH